MRREPLAHLVANTICYISLCHSELQYKAGDPIQWPLNSPPIPIVFDSLLRLKTKKNHSLSNQWFPTQTASNVENY